MKSANDLYVAALFSAEHYVNDVIADLLEPAVNEDGEEATA